MTKNKKITLIVIMSLGILVALSLVLMLNSNKIFRVAEAPSHAPIFTFNESKAPGWWAAENYNSKASTKSEEYQGGEPIDKLPVASINVFKGKKGEYATACFVMFSYYDYKADVAQLKKDTESGYVANGSAKNIGENSVVTNILGKGRELSLVKYELTGPDAENAMKGMSYGWVNLDDGYVSVSGVCPTGAELDDTLAVINATYLINQ